MLEDEDHKLMQQFAVYFGMDPYETWVLVELVFQASELTIVISRYMSSAT